MAHCNASNYADSSIQRSLVPSTPPPVGEIPAPAVPPGVSRSATEARYRARSREARRVNRWKGRVVGLFDQLGRDQFPIRHDVRDGDLAEALDVAIEDVLLRMSPLSDEEARLPENRWCKTPPLRQDVALTVGGRILAVVRWTPAGPVVHRFFSQPPSR